MMQELKNKALNIDKITLNLEPSFVVRAIPQLFPVSFVSFLPFNGVVKAVLIKLK